MQNRLKIEGTNNKLFSIGNRNCNCNSFSRGRIDGARVMSKHQNITTPTDQDKTPFCRIVTFETPKGTNYIAERRVWKNKWFSKPDWEWEAFAKIDKSSFYHERFKVLPYYEKGYSQFEDKSYAEYACQEWERVMSSGKVIKTWSVDDE